MYVIIIQKSGTGSFFVMSFLKTVSAKILSDSKNKEVPAKNSNVGFVPFVLNTAHTEITLSNSSVSVYTKTTAQST